MPYSDLSQALDISTARELEDLIIDAIYLDLLHGKLDQKEEQLEVTHTMGETSNQGNFNRSWLLSKIGEDMPFVVWLRVSYYYVF